MSRNFSEGVLKRAERVGSRIVFAFDPSDRGDLEDVRGILLKLKSVVVGVKFGLPAFLLHGSEGLKKLIDPLKDEYFFVCDLKLADIGYINRLVAERVFEIGFDALIVHAFVGIREGLEGVVKLAEKEDKGVLAVCAMSHAGAEEHLNKNFEALMDSSYSAGVDGFILPGTFPHFISSARKKYPDLLIFSPGVGAQGAPFGSALKVGADFEIIGRAISSSPDPFRKAQEIKKVVR